MPSAFSSYEPHHRLENFAISTSNRNQTSALVQLTCSVVEIFSSQSSPPIKSNIKSPRSTTLNITLPDGRLNLGTHLPLLARRYRYLSTLGEGVSCQVFLAEDTAHPSPPANTDYSSGHLVTIKAMKRHHKSIGLREARTLRFLNSQISEINSKSIIHLKDMFILGGHHCCLVMDRQYPRLLDWVADSVLFTKSVFVHKLCKIAYQLLGAVEFLHNHGIVHADIKPDNIVMTQPPGSNSVEIRLIDFGGSYSTTETDMEQLSIAEIQTLSYRSPEAALGLVTNERIDEWSVGVVLSELALQRPLFPVYTNTELLLEMVRVLGVPFSREALLQSRFDGQHDMIEALCTEHNQEEDKDGDDGDGDSGGCHRYSVPQETLVSLGISPSLCIKGGDTSGGGSSRHGGTTTTTTTTTNRTAKCLLQKQLERVDYRCADLIMNLLEYDVEKRMSARDALSTHPFFSDFAWIRPGDMEKAAVPIKAALLHNNDGDDDQHQYLLKEQCSDDDDDDLDDGSSDADDERIEESIKVEDIQNEEMSADDEIETPRDKSASKKRTSGAALMTSTLAKAKRERKKDRPWWMVS